jgi:hypothetical protein
VARRDPRSARLLGLWTAGWLAVLLLGGLLWLGDLSLQWPVLVIPLIWALVALRPRRRGGDRDEDDDWEPIPPPDRSWRQDQRPDLGHRTDTVERPALRNRDADDRY